MTDLLGLDSEWERACLDWRHTTENIMGRALMVSAHIKSPIDVDIDINVIIDLPRLKWNDVAALQSIYLTSSTSDQTSKAPVTYPTTDTARDVQPLLSSSTGKTCRVVIKKQDEIIADLMTSVDVESPLAGYPTGVFASFGEIGARHLDLMAKRLIQISVVESVEYFLLSWNPQWMPPSQNPILVNPALPFRPGLHLTRLSQFVSEMIGHGPDAAVSQPIPSKGTRSSPSAKQRTGQTPQRVVYQRAPRLFEFTDHSLVESLKGASSIPTISESIIKRFHPLRHARYLERSKLVQARSGADLSEWRLSDHLDMGGLAYGHRDLRAELNRYRGTSTLVLAKPSANINEQYWFVVGTRGKAGQSVSEVALCNGETTRCVTVDALLSEASEHHAITAAIVCNSDHMFRPIHQVALRDFMGNGKVLTDKQVVTRGLYKRFIEPAEISFPALQTRRMHRIKWLSDRYEFYRTPGLNSAYEPFLMTGGSPDEQKLGMVVLGMPFIPHEHRGKSLGVDLLRAALEDDSYRHLCPTSYSEAGHRNRLKLHRTSVEQALEQGLEIPIIVMRDYPDLFPTEKDKEIDSEPRYAGMI